MAEILIKNGTLIDPLNNIKGVYDIHIKDGIINQIGENLSIDGAEIIDASGKYVAPGLVDMHCHLREPGFEYKEDIESGTKSAAMGGFTSVACMPNTQPVTDNEVVVSYIKNKAKDTGVVNVYPIGSISKGLKGEELAEIGSMKEAGAVGVSDDGRPVMNSALMKKALLYAKMFDIPVISHCEDLNLVEGGSMHEGYYSTFLGLRGINPAAEEVHISREILLAKSTGTKVHIAHVSTKTGVGLIREAKNDGVAVTCETCPHYFTLDHSACDGYKTNAKMNPPLRTSEDVEGIIVGLQDGTIDAIATDHAPHHRDEKEVEFEKAANGIIGFETAFPLGITYLVNQGRLTLAEFIEKMSVYPSKILNLNKGSLGVSKDADIIIFDKDADYIVDVDKFKSKGKNSPYDGFKLTGKILYTIVAGKIIVKNGELI